MDQTSTDHGKTHARHRPWTEVGTLFLLELEVDLNNFVGVEVDG